ncbi:ELWxxDGT repeat protein [Methylobacterium sp. sgz302003]|uniref:ELWxxDGT repeat protein n=1 Tax=Methylobacterium oryzisoli TaxID=3385502 RepID=UPI00397DFBED
MTASRIFVQSTDRDRRAGGYFGSAVTGIEGRDGEEAFAQALDGPSGILRSIRGTDESVRRIPGDRARAASHKPALRSGEAEIRIASRSTDRRVATGRREVAFIDQSVDGWEALARGVSDRARVVLLDEGQDGLSQIAAWAVGRPGHDAVHILCHATPGVLRLGCVRLDRAALAVRADEIRRLGQLLKADGDILLYGCELAKGPAGAAWLDAFADLAEANVAASVTLTGAAHLGGDFTLAARIGSVTTPGFAIPAFRGVLAPSPGYSSAMGYVGESTVTILFDLPLDEAHPPLPNAFNVQVNGTTVGISGVSVDGAATTVTLTLGSFILVAGDIVDFTYTDPTVGNDVDAIQGTAGSDVADFNHSTVVAISRPVAPAFVGAAVTGTSLVLTYDTALDAAHAPAAGAFTVTVGGNAVSVTGVAVDGPGKTVTLTLAQAVSQGQAVTVAYADPTGGDDASALQGTSGTDAASLPATGVTNLTGQPASQRFVFSANDGATGAELWVTDGTEAGTTRLKDINPGGNGSGAANFTALGNGKAVFSASDTAGNELWVTDGTAAGTSRVKDIYAGATSSGPANFTALGNGQTVFSANDGATGSELWVTDGTADGTTRVKDINPGAGGSTPLAFTALGNGKAVFRAADASTGAELWVTNGTEAGTSRVKDINPGVTGSGLAGFMALGNGKVLFSASDGTAGNELWVTDGTETGTSRVKDIVAGTTGSNPTGFTALGNGKAVFSANDVTMGYELWVTDGTEAGTTRVKDIRAGTGSSLPSNFMTLGNGKVLFRADDGTTGGELWVTDGTEAGTSRVKDIYAGAISSGAAIFTALGNGKAVFNANDGITGSELWVTDGTEAGTSRVKDINSGANGSAPVRFTALGNGKALFSADDGTAGPELWVTDGTEAGTTRLKDINPGTTGSAPSIAVAVTAPADTTPPVISAVSIPNQPMKAGDTVTATITVASDSDTYTLGAGSTVAGFALGNLTRVNATTYTAGFTVAAGQDVAAGADLPVNLVLTDTAGNSSAAYTTAIVQGQDGIDATPPSHVSAAVTGASLVLTYSEALDAAHAPAANAFTVTVGGSAVSVTGVAVDGLAKTVTLTLAQAVQHGQAVTVAYADPSGWATSSRSTPPPTRRASRWRPARTWRRAATCR